MVLRFPQERSTVACGFMNEKATRLDKFKPAQMDDPRGVRGARTASLPQDLGLSSVRKPAVGLSASQTSADKPEP